MAHAPDDAWASRAERMVEQQIVARDVSDQTVLNAMRSIPRHLFLPDEERARAYDDGPQSIGLGQTISQPLIVAVMTQLARLTPKLRVLEVGTGSGYQTAVLAACAGEVFTIEIEPELAARAAKTLRALGVTNVRYKVGDGGCGWPEAAPFEAIVVTAAPADVPPKLLDQLGEGGRLVIPLGTTSQHLYVYTREPDGVQRRSVFPVRFVPLR